MFIMTYDSTWSYSVRSNSLVGLHVILRGQAPQAFFMLFCEVKLLSQSSCYLVRSSSSATLPVIL